MEESSDLYHPQQSPGFAIERWSFAHLCCPACGGKLIPFQRGTKVYDCYCARCFEKYQIKAKKGELGTWIQGSAYLTSLDRYVLGDFPSYIVVVYEGPRIVPIQGIAINRRGFTSESIVRRNPTTIERTETHQQRIWYGFDIDLREIDRIAQIDFMTSGRLVSLQTMLEAWRRSTFELEIKRDERKWLFDVYWCVKQLNTSFNISELYEYEPWLAKLHPNNRNIRAKIRQQLQGLRDMGLLIFSDNKGYYRRTVR